MRIHFSQPVALGWRRTKLALFQPFDTGRWFVLGFTAWLAQLGNGSDSGSGLGYRVEQNLDRHSLAETGDAVWQGLTAFPDNVLGFLLMGFLLAAVLLFAALLLWLSSRGRFMLLDNLVQSRSGISRPWREFEAHGNSLFLWRICYTVVLLVLGAVVAGGLALAFVPAFGLPDGLRLLAAVCLGSAGFLLLVTSLYVEYFLDYFVVPIMYRQGLSVTAAWGRFLALFRTEPGAFALFGVIHLAILIAFMAAYFIGGLLTCCLGLALLAIPYLGTVLSLPIPVLGVFMNLEFLAQFGPDFRVLPPLDAGETGDSGQFDTDGTMVRTEDVGQDTGSGEPGPQDA